MFLTLKQSTTNYQVGYTIGNTAGDFSTQPSHTFLIDLTFLIRLDTDGFGVRAGSSEATVLQSETSSPGHCLQWCRQTAGCMAAEFCMYDSCAGHCKLHNKPVSSPDETDDSWFIFDLTGETKQSTTKFCFLLDPFFICHPSLLTIRFTIDYFVLVYS